ncbi:TonB-linked SusC/RagA family outer membrane protein [Mucilaginibacter frigoritolerans]|uniref:TonB-linked SusC/RagA family outer membrane protein n=1 Tax=Mucilaginibacter frigoritolerans TaxID=652788 RepID=A0A562U8A1_9SPHI|nr:SusC/RagA family TonB-linked outer membrane protein [Mucilaginibacter frigoritolerans]TWJ01687.1 TonB-linked SusC/RagA family outer membrane protein [Mucilaginibacter frigoritolerans]
MKKKLLTCFIVCSSAGAFVAGSAMASASSRHLLAKHAQSLQVKADQTIKGTVKDESGVSLPGVSVVVKGTTKGTQTDVNGGFTLTANQGDILVFSYIGYNTKEVTIGANAIISVTLVSNASQLDQVVVTALGIKRSQKSLTYAQQQISGSELNDVKTDNLMNSLNGKVAGLAIEPSASGVGGSAKVLLRGSRSFAGNNQPLYVIDGVPMANPVNYSGTTTTNGGQPGDNFGGSPDGGDGISNLNPDDIESVTVLEGASAAALYGSQAANGVIVITTKKGKAGKTEIHYSSSFQASNAVSEPKFQNQYGQTAAGSATSWGPAISTSENNLKDFFRTGTNWTNAINLSTGTDIGQTYASYANTSANGIEPGNELRRNNFDLRETGHFLNNKLTVDGNVNYIDQDIKNSPGLGLYINPLVGLYLFPRGLNILPYKNQYLLPNNTGTARQNWVTPNDDSQEQNPWWVTNMNTNNLQRNRIIFNGSAKYDFTKWFNVQIRGSLDRTNDSYNQDLYSGTIATFNSNGNGHYSYSNQVTEQKYADAIANFTPAKFGAFKFDGLVGAAINDSQLSGLGASGDLSTPDFFTPYNIIAGHSAPIAFSSHTQIQSIFEAANLSYKDYLYLALTNRTDWNSTLAFTNKLDYNYPSVGLTAILSQMFSLPQAISYAKIRASYAGVANGLPAFTTIAQNTQSSSGALIFNTTAPLHTLKPEDTHSYEFGTDWKFLGNRINFSFTYYNTHTYNQYFALTPPAATLISTGYVNAGDIQNTGFEVLIGADIVRSNNFKWNSSITASANKNKIISLDPADNLNQAILTGNDGGGFGYESVIAKGGSFGDIYGYTTVRNSAGQMVLSGTNASNYAPQKNSTMSFVGNPNPKFQLGWSNSFNFGPLNFDFLVDGKFGGQVLSLTQAMLDSYGVSQVSGTARANGGVTVNAVNQAGTPVTTVNAQTWYQTIGGRNALTDQYIYSATVVRLRQAALGYTWPVANSVVKNVKLSLIGRNLFYFYKKAPFDPEVATSTGNGLSGVDLFNQPATRNVGLDLNVSF